MIKATKGNMLILGFSDENLKRLKEDQPIKFNLQEVGMGDIDMFIFNGKDEQTMQQMMKERIHPYKTKIVDERGAKNN